VHDQSKRDCARKDRQCPQARRYGTGGGFGAEMTTVRPRRFSGHAR
jgi:hypothetical protein